MERKHSYRSNRPKHHDVVQCDGPLYDREGSCAVHARSSQRSRDFDIVQPKEAEDDERYWYDFSESCTLLSQPLYDPVFEPSQDPLTITPSSGYISPEVDSFGAISDNHHYIQHVHPLGKWRRVSEPPPISGTQLTLNFSVHVSSGSNGDSSQAASSAAVSQYTIECSPDITITQRQKSAERTAVYRNQPSQESPLMEDLHEHQGTRLPSLVHATSPSNDEVLQHLMPQLMQYMDPKSLLPYLQKYSLVSQDDVDYIMNPLRTEDERRQRIVTRSPIRDPEAFDRFVKCLAEEPEHTGHKYLTRRLREAIERKRQHPFKRLSSFRQQKSPPSTHVHGGLMQKSPPSTYVHGGRMQESPPSTYVHRGRMQESPPSTHVRGGRMQKSPPSTHVHGGRMQKSPPSTHVHGGRMQRRSSEQLERSTIHYFMERTSSMRERQLDKQPAKLHRQHSASAADRTKSPSCTTTPPPWESKPLTSCHKRSESDTSSIYGALKEEKLTKRKMVWLQEKVQFRECSETILFSSKTHYGQERRLLYSGALIERGKVRFVVLFNDMLLVLKTRSRAHSMGKLGTVFSTPTPQLDWFAEQTYTTRTPFLLHLLTVQKQSKKNYVCLNYKHHSAVKEICLQACSEEAKRVWEEQLLEAIKLCTASHAETVLHVGTREEQRQSGQPYTKLTVRIPAIDAPDSLPLYCSVKASGNRCRTPTFSGATSSEWDFTCEFTDLIQTTSFMLCFDLYKENIFQPDELLGSAGVQLSTMPADQPGLHVMQGELSLDNSAGTTIARLAVHTEIGWETKM